MSYKKREINTGAIFHVLNRGVDKRGIFLNEGDYLRFVHNLFEFNNEGPITNSNYLFQKTPTIISPILSSSQDDILVKNQENFLLISWLFV